jgi:hypothetical protein
MRKAGATMAKKTVTWPDEVDEVIAGDLTVALGCVTQAGGVVVTGVAPCGLRDRARGTVGFTTSLAFGKKLEHIIGNPRTALAYHTPAPASCSSTAGPRLTYGPKPSGSNGSCRR